MTTTPFPRGRSRRRALIVLFAAVVGAAGTARLGVWQLDRAAQKEALQQALDSRVQLPPVPAAMLADTPAAAVEQHYRRIAVRGHWISTATVFLDNRQMDARQGFFVVTPLRLSEAPGVVLVQRGWAPRDLLDRTKVPRLADDPGEVTVIGHIAPPPGRLYDFAGAASGAIRQNLELADFAQELSLPLKPLSIVQDAEGAPQDGLLRQWPRPDLGIQRHYGYAFQWFALCALMTGLYVWFQLVRPRLGSRR
ncbi:MAG: transmembrane cytochrome oxidase [Burkholderiales bacterium PBB1]|nr:MAG: transmembrane cytochrome oxidase [Burkholderiales bacterium PBB1]